MTAQHSPKPIYAYVGGSGRSGTTTLRRALCASGKAVCFNEPKFMVAEGGFTDLLAGRVSPGRFSKLMMLDYARRVEETTGLQRDDLSALLAEAAQTSNGNTGFACNFLRLYHRALADRHPGLALMEKEPHVLVLADFIHGLFPDVRFIHIFREPRDVCCSVMASSWGPGDVKGFVAWYNQTMRAIITAMHGLPESHHAVISLETLCADPKACLAPLFQLMDLTPGTTDIERAASTIEVDQANLGRHKRELTAGNAAFVMQHCAAYHNELQRMESAWLRKSKTAADQE